VMVPAPRPSRCTVRRARVIAWFIGFVRAAGSSDR
jgi:hypothetical protein